MQARGPPRNVNIFPHTPGMDAVASGVVSHLSGLKKKGVLSRRDHYPKKEMHKTHLNSKESSPHIDFARFKARMGINNVWPFLILSRDHMSHQKSTRNRNSRDSIHHSSILVFDRLTERQDIVLSGYPHC